MNIRLNIVGLGLYILPVLFMGCANPGHRPSDATLTIRWQRLINDAGDTCDRCGETERSIAEAERLLTASLRPLGMNVRVVKTQLTAAEFKRDPSASNRIWIGDNSLEAVLGAQTGTSPCDGACGGSPCRVTVVDGQSYEVVPAELIIRAGMRVAADLVRPPKRPMGCCPPGGTCPTPAGSDLQPMPWLTQQGQ